MRSSTVRCTRRRSPKDGAGLAEEYADLSDEAKAFLVNAHYTLNNDDVIKGDDTHHTIAEGMSRYDYMVKKNMISNFMSRTISPENGMTNYSVTTEDGSLTAIIIIVSMVSISGIGACLFIKKRRYSVK